MERKIAYIVLMIVTLLWAISVFLTFLDRDRIVDPTLSAMMTTIVGGVLIYIYKTRNGNGTTER